MLIVYRICCQVIKEYPKSWKDPDAGVTYNYHEIMEQIFLLLYKNVNNLFWVNTVYTLYLFKYFFSIIFYLFIHSLKDNKSIGYFYRSVKYHTWI